MYFLNVIFLALFGAKFKPGVHYSKGMNDHARVFVLCGKDIRHGIQIVWVENYTFEEDIFYSTPLCH
jgi:hypothetical protein